MIRVNLGQDFLEVRKLYTIEMSSGAIWLLSFPSDKKTLLEHNDFDVDSIANNGGVLK